MDRRKGVARACGERRVEYRHETCRLGCVGPAVEARCGSLLEVAVLTSWRIVGP